MASNKCFRLCSVLFFFFDFGFSRHRYARPAKCARTHIHPRHGDKHVRIPPPPTRTHTHKHMQPPSTTPDSRRLLCASWLSLSASLVVGAGRLLLLRPSECAARLPQCSTYLPGVATTTLLTSRPPLLVRNGNRGSALPLISILRSITSTPPPPPAVYSGHCLHSLLAFQPTHSPPSPELSS